MLPAPHDPRRAHPGGDRTARGDRGRPGCADDIVGNISAVIASPVKDRGAISEHIMPCCVSVPCSTGGSTASARDSLPMRGAACSPPSSSSRAGRRRRSSVPAMADRFRPGRLAQRARARRGLSIRRSSIPSMPDDVALELSRLARPLSAPLSSTTRLAAKWQRSRSGGARPRSTAERRPADGQRSRSRRGGERPRKRAIRPTGYASSIASRWRTLERPSDPASFEVQDEGSQLAARSPMAPRHARR